MTGRYVAEQSIGSAGYHIRDTEEGDLIRNPNGVLYGWHDRAYATRQAARLSALCWWTVEEEGRPGYRVWGADLAEAAVRAARPGYPRRISGHENVFDVYSQQDDLLPTSRITLAPAELLSRGQAIEAWHRRAVTDVPTARQPD